MKRSIDQIRADHQAWCKDEPAFAATIGKPPTKVTKWYNRVAALDHDLRELIPPGFGVNAKAPDPFGDLLDALRVIEHGWGKRHGRFADGIDQFDPHDPLRAAEEAIWEIRHSIRASGTPVEVEHLSGLYDTPADGPSLMTVELEIDGYDVDVSRFRRGFDRLLEIEKSLADNDKRRSAVCAARCLVGGFTHCVMTHLSAKHLDQVFHFEFNKTDRTRFGHCHMPLAGS